ncbi:unnamed protein product [Somion occarium]|uniref:Uncharacterized protein n=1 Tax=Somion occarium TaxID=3059160 RepID=A0ABP1DAM2_9APHY
MWLCVVVYLVVGKKAPFGLEASCRIRLSFSTPYIKSIYLFGYCVEGNHFSGAVSTCLTTGIGYILSSTPFGSLVGVNRGSQVLPAVGPELDASLSAALVLIPIAGGLSRLLHRLATGSVVLSPIFATVALIVVMVLVAKVQNSVAVNSPFTVFWGNGEQPLLRMVRWSAHGLMDSGNRCKQRIIQTRPVATARS